MGITPYCGRRPQLDPEQEKKGVRAEPLLARRRLTKQAENARPARFKASTLRAASISFFWISNRLYKIWYSSRTRSLSVLVVGGARIQFAGLGIGLGGALEGAGGEGGSGACFLDREG